MAQPTAFVTGGTGFLGLNLVQLLIREGWDVTAIHRPTSDLTRLKRFEVNLREASLGDVESLRAAMPQGVDAVFHMAASTTFWRPLAEQQFQDNVIGTRNVVRAALDNGAKRFIHTSSSAAYGKHEDVRVNEETVSNAETSRLGYFRTKYLAEKEVRTGIAEGLDAVMINPANVLGPYDTRNWGRSFMMAQKGRLPGFPGKGTFCHSEEVANAHLAAFKEGRTGENYLLACTDATYLEVAQIIYRLLGKKEPRHALPKGVLAVLATGYDAVALFTRKEPDLTRDLLPFLTGNHTFDGEKARRELGYSSRSIEDILTDCHTWLRAEGLIS